MIGISVADIHGNKTQYQKLRQLVAEQDIDCVFMCGDLMPKTGGTWTLDNKVRTIAMQRDFIESFFIDYLRDLGGLATIYLVFGNDDFRSNYPLIEQANIANVYLLDRQVVKLQSADQDLYVAGYPYVGLTPFLHKDWEKWDVEPGQANHKIMRTDGYSSRDGGHYPVDYQADTDLQATIKQDLATLAGQSDPRQTIYVFHEAPYDTPLDQVALDNKYIEDGRVHVGSQAIRDFILEHSPLLTMHGHIHETCDESGDFRWQNEASISFTAANDFTSNQLTYVRFDLSNPAKAVRTAI